MGTVTKNIFYNFVGQSLVMILGMVAVKFIFRDMGEDVFGIICFTILLNGAVCLVLEMGVCSTTVREVSQNIDSKRGYVKDLIQTYSLFFVFTYLVIVCLLFILAPLIIKNWVNLNSMQPEEAVKVFRVLGAGSLIALPKSFYASVLNGLQKMGLSNIIDVLTSGLQQLGTIIILLIGGNVMHVVFWLSLCFIGGGAAYALVISNLLCYDCLIPKFNSYVIKQNMRFSLRVMFITVSGAIHNNIDKIVLSKFASVGSFGYYSFTYTTVLKGALLSGAVSRAVLPHLSSIYKSGDAKEFQKQYCRLHDIMCFGMIPVFAGIYFLFVPVFSFIFNKTVAKNLFLPGFFLCLGFCMNGTMTLPYIASLATGHPGITARKHAIDFLVTIPITIVLIYYFSLVGASLSIVIFYLVAYFYSVPRIYNECLRTSPIVWYRHILKLILLVILSYGPGQFLLFHTDYGLAKCLSYYLICSAGFLIGAWFIVCDDIRQLVLKYRDIIFRRIVSES
jgi:O-antigen/teichoic acid export membrane protein